MTLEILLQASKTAAMGNMLLLGGMGLVMYFFMIKPQSKKAKEQKAFNTGIKVGDKIVTIGGVHGKIAQINNDGTLKLDCDRNNFITIEQSAISMEMTVAYLKKTETPVIA
jgi:preprotein translocase subunit YajC